jgi:hypothetical protein
MKKTMTIHLKNGKVLEILVSDNWKITTDKLSNGITGLFYPNAENDDNGLQYIRLDEVIAVFVR